MIIDLLTTTTISVGVKYLFDQLATMTDRKFRQDRRINELKGLVRASPKFI